MRGYSATEVFHVDELLLLREAEGFVRRVDDPGGEIRCHELARAFQSVWPEWHGRKLEVVDGKFGIVEHSWIDVWCVRRKLVLDLYSVGRLPMVQLIVNDFKFLLPFVAGAPRDDVRQDVVDALRRRVLL